MSETPNSTTACRPSVRMSRRNVVTSWGWWWRSSTATVPCSIPTGTVWEKSRRTSSGGAAVARSKSWFSRPSRLSRSAPPTHHVSKPASSSRRAISSTSGGIGRRSGKFMRCEARKAERGTRNCNEGSLVGRHPRVCSAFRIPHSAFGSPTQHAPPVHVQNLSRDVPRQVRTQKHDRTRHVLGTGDAPERNRRLDVTFPLSPFPLVRSCRHLRIHPSRGDAVHRDPRRELERQRLGERQH